jgi:hypothetical protein
MLGFELGLGKLCGRQVVLGLLIFFLRQVRVRLHVQEGQTYIGNGFPVVLPGVGQRRLLWRHHVLGALIRRGNKSLLSRIVLTRTRDDVV